MYNTQSEKKDETFTCPFSTCANDRPNKIAYLGWRFLYTIIAWVVLGNNIEISRSYFVSLFLFSVPLLMDYLKFSPKEKVRSVIRGVAICNSMIWIIMGIIGLFDILKLEKLDDIIYVSISDNFIVLKNFHLRMDTIWYIMGLCVVLTGIDWIVNKSNLEVHYTTKPLKSISS